MKMYLQKIFVKKSLQKYFYVSNMPFKIKVQGFMACVTHKNLFLLPFKSLKKATYNKKEILC